MPSTGNIFDVADQGKANPRIGSLCVGDEGVSGTVDGHGAERLKATTTSGELKQMSTGSWPSQEECIRMPLASEVTISASPAGSQYQGLIIEWLTGAVISAEEHAEQLRLEELAAAEEGAAIEASGYPDPAENVRFA